MDRAAAQVVRDDTPLIARPLVIGAGKAEGRRLGPARVARPSGLGRQQRLPQRAELLLVGFRQRARQRLVRQEAAAAVDAAAGRIQREVHHHDRDDDAGQRKHTGAFPSAVACRSGW